MPIETELTWCYIKAVRANMITNRMRITVETALDDESLEAKRSLALLAVEAAPATITFAEHQIQLPFTKPASEQESKGA